MVDPREQTPDGDDGLNRPKHTQDTSGRIAALESGLEVGPDLYVVKLPVSELREQDVNAHTMSPTKFERLVENIRLREALESLPYCYAAEGKPPVEVVSGHHRIRAALAAGLHEIPLLLDVRKMPRSTVVAKQLAHNALVGTDDPDIINQLLAEIDSPDDRLATGLNADVLEGQEQVDVAAMFAPRIDFDYRTVSFAFLPHQQAEVERLIELLEGRQDLVVVAPIEQYDELLTVAARYARLKGVRSGATAITLMVRLALAELEAQEEVGKDAAADETD